MIPDITDCAALIRMCQLSDHPGCQFILRLAGADPDRQQCRILTGNPACQQGGQWDQAQKKKKQRFFQKAAVQKE